MATGSVAPWVRSAAVVCAALLVVCSQIGTGRAAAWAPESDSWPDLFKPGYKNCDGDWTNGCETDVQTDVDNCGDCGVECPAYPYATPSCDLGECGSVCDTNYEDCNGNPEDGCEVNVKTDLRNCGSCGCTCPVYPYSIVKCNGGECESTCKPWWADCNAVKEDGCEVDIGQDVMNCGSCGCACPVRPYSTPKCSSGKCTNVCNPGWSDCNGKEDDGCEVNVNTDMNNCGACGIKCPAGYKCQSGKCVSVCKPGYKDCNNNAADGCEINIYGDVNNCGDCGTKCAVYPYSIAKCSGGKCGSTCKPWWADCNSNWKDGCEVDLGQDVKNCGKCGVKCPTYKYSNPTCSRGVCGSVCQSGWKDCNAKKGDSCEVNVLSDANNCGACGKKCPASGVPNAHAVCRKGSCGHECKSGFQLNSKKLCVKQSNY